MKINFSDGSSREIDITLGTFRRLKRATGIDFFVDMSKLTPEYFPDLIAASLVGEPTLSGDEVADLIGVADLANVSEAITIAFGQKADPNDQGTA